MKAGQILSVVDASWVGNGQLSAYQAALAQLQADAPPMDATLAREVLHADHLQVEKYCACHAPAMGWGRAV